MTDNRYLSLLRNDQPTTDDPRRRRADELTNKYADIISADSAQRAQINVLPDTNPDVAARANRYERQFGVPAGVAQDEIGSYDAMARQRRVAEAARDHPNIARFLSDPRAAAVAHDDTPTLRAMSQQFQAFWAKKPEAPKTWTQRAREIASGFGGSLVAGVYGAAEGVTQGLRAAGEIRQQIDPFYMALDALTGTSERVAKANAGGKQPDLLNDLIATQRAAAKQARPTGNGFVGDSLYAGVESVPTSLLALGSGLAGAAGAGLAAVGGIAGGQAYGQGRDAGLSPLRAGAFAAGQGAVEVATERIPVMKFLEDTKVGTPFFKRLAKNLVAEQVGEQTATAVQDLNQWASIDVNKGKTFGDYLKERPEAAAQTALAVAATVGTTNVAVEAGVRVTDKVQRIIGAQDNAGRLDKVMAAAATSKARQRDPDTFQQFVEQGTENGEAEHVYLPVEAVDTLMQSETFEDEDGLFEGLRDQIDEARATGGDVVVPLAQVAAKLAGTPSWEALKDDARLQAGGLSLRESVQQGEEVTRTLEQRGAEIMQAAQDEATVAEPAQQVYDEVRDQLIGVGFTAQAASHQAALFSASREAWGKRLGTDALSYHRANPVEFRRGEFDTGGAQRVMDQATAQERFTPKAWEAARESGDRIVYLTPQQFLSVAAQDAPRDTSVETVGGVLTRGEQLTDLPELALRTGSDGSAIVDMHDGRHRARALAEQGDTLIPVRVAGDGDLSKVFPQGGGDPLNLTGVDEQSYTSRSQNAPKVNPSKASSGPSDDELLAELLNQGVRGQIALYPERNVITLFENADLSTLIHELGHQFLEELQKNATAENAPADVVADWESVKKWFADNGQPVDGTIPREAHELWARGFERYAMEGKAPSSALQAAFTAFRGWLLRIYEVVSRLRSPINPEIRQVMDRMLATQDAIDAYSDEQSARALFTDAAQAGMTEAEFDAYQKTIGEARDDAYDALLFRTMARIKQTRERRMKEETRAIRDEAETAIADQPRFVALRLLRTGKLRDAEEKLPIKLDRAWLVMRYGEDIEGRLPANIHIGEGDTTIADDVAEMTGFASGGEMIEALLDIQSQTKALRLLGDKRQLREKLVDDAVDAAIVDTGIGDPLTDGSLEEEAIAAIHNEKQGEVISSEARALARRTNARPTPYRLAREWAKRKIEAGRVNDVASRSAMQRYARATAKAARLAETAILEGNVDEAFRQKQAQLLNHALLVEAKAAADEIDTVVARLNKLAKRAAMQSIDQDYFDRVHALLEGYSFRAASQKGLDELENFREWATQRATDGFEVFVPARLAAATQHYSRVSVDELFGLRDAVDSLMTLGRHKQRMLDGQKEREFAEVIADIRTNIRTLPDRVLPKMFNETSAKPMLDRGRQIMRDWTAGGLKISTLALEMDGQNPNGPMMNLLVHRATDAENKRARLRDMVLIPLSERYTNMTRKDQKRLEEKVTIPGLFFNVGLDVDDPRLGQPVTVTRKELLSIALNTGNISNFEKMTRGERWNPQTLREALDANMSKDDWQFVQAMWDGVEKLWPYIVETERALSGVVPEKVSRLPIETQHGVFDGGYWPVVYDADRSGRAEDNSDKAADDLFGNKSGIGTPKGHTITRTDAIGPLTYSFDRILMHHLEQVITRLSYAEYARDVIRVTGNENVRGLIDLKLGREYRRQIKPWLQRQIVSYVNLDGAKFMEKLLRYTRQGITVVGMGLRFSTGVAQLSGLTASLARLGAKQTPRLVNNMRRTLMGIPAMAMGKQSEVHDFVFSRSEQMQRRVRESSVEIDTTFRKLAGKHNYMDTISAWSMWHIGMIDLHIVSIPTWLTGYQKAVNQGMTDEQASRYADQMVVTSQGGGRAKDLSAWQSQGSEAQKLFVMFYTPFNVLFNAQWEAARGAKRGDYARAANLTFFFLVAQMLTDALLSGDWPKDDDEDPEGMPMATIRWAARNVGFGMFSGVPFVRDVATYAERSSTGQYASFGGTPIARMFEDSLRSGKRLYQIQQGEKDFTPDAIPGIANTVGAFAHVPLGQPGQTTKFLWQYQRGEVEPKTAGDWWNGIAKGKIEEEKKR